MASNSYFTLLTGTDVFISYRWSANAKQYVTNLCDQFGKRGLDAYLDDNSLAKGESIPKALELAIRRSRMFVLLVTDDVGESTWVPRELAIATKHNRKIVPICIGSALNKLALDKAPWDAIRDLNRVDESEASLLAGAPSNEVPEKIDQSYTFTRRKVKAIRILFGAGLAFFLISLIAIGLGAFALLTKWNADTETSRLRGEAAQLQTDITDLQSQKNAAERAATEADESRKTAIGQRDNALTEKGTAERAAKEARTKADQAETDQKEAEKLTRKATADRLVGEARRVISQSPQKSMLISLEALNATLDAGDPPTFMAQQTLLDSLNRRGGRIFRMKDQNPVEDVVMNSAGSLLLMEGKGKGEVWKVDQFPQRLKRLADVCKDLQISPGGRWAITTCSKGSLLDVDTSKPVPPPPAPSIMIYDLSSVDEELKPVSVVSSILPRDVFNDPEARWLMENDVIVGPTFEEALARKPARDPEEVKKQFKKEIEASPYLTETMILRIRQDVKSYLHSPDWRWLLRDDQPDAEKWEQIRQAKAPQSLWKLYDTHRPANQKVTLELPAGTSFLGFSSGSRWLITGTPDKHIKVYDLHGNLQLPSGKLLVESEWGFDPKLTFSPDDQWMVLSTPGKVKRIWRLASSESVTLAGVETARGEEIVFSPDSKSLAINSQLGDFSFWKLDVKTHEWKQFDPLGTRVDVFEIKFSRDSRWLLMWGKVGLRVGVRIRDLAIEKDVLIRDDNSVTPAFYDLGEDERAVDFSPDSAWLVTKNDAAENYSGYTLWDLKENKPHEKPMRLNGIESATPVFSVDSHWLMFVGDTSRIYNLRNILETREPEPGVLRRNRDGRFELSPNKRWKITNIVNSPLLLWDAQSNPIDSDPFVLAGSAFGYDSSRPGNRTSDTFSSDSNWLVTHSENNHAFLWDLRDPTRPRQALEFQTLVRVVAFSPNGRFMVSAPNNTTVRVWQLGVSANGESYFDLRLGQSAALLLSFSLDERWLLAKTENREGYLFDLANRVGTLQLITPDTWSLSEAEFAGDGMWLVTKEGFTADPSRRAYEAFDRYRTKLWDLSGLRPKATEFPKQYLKSRFDPSSHWLQSENKEEIQLTDLRNRRALQSFSFPRKKNEEVTYMASGFSGNGNWFASCESDEFYLFDLRGPSPKRTRLIAPTRALGDPFFSPDGRWLLSILPGVRDWLVWDLRRPGSQPFTMPATSDASVLDYMNGRSWPEPVFSSDGKWVVYQFKLFDLRGNQPVACDVNGPEGIKNVWVEGFSNDSTWAIGTRRIPWTIVGEKEPYRVFWDLRASVLAPQLFLTSRDHGPRQMDVFAPIMSYDYEHPSINSMLVLDELAKLARASAGLKLTAEERSDLILPENKSRP